MGRLIDQGRRRHAQEARKRRTERIVAAAAYMFERLPYTQVTLDSISQQAKVKKGIASMYFGSREELFLILISRESDRWFDALDRRLADSGAVAGPADAAELLAEQARDGHLFPRLLSLLAAVLDHNLDIQAVVPFLRGLRSRLDRAGEGLADLCGSLDAEQGTRLIRLVLTLLAGANPFSHPIGIGSVAMTDASLAPVRIDMERELPELLEIVLARFWRPSGTGS